ncbi:hypothetical protein AAHA92_06279 [Salvia divinorum]|uniref:Uncharacterized protein n=1 Tax=Salvia divinorum TaxID=28513 RepID=A0ABD1I8P8_SALDI
MTHRRIRYLISAISLSCSIFSAAVSPSLCLLLSRQNRRCHACPPPKPCDSSADSTLLPPWRSPLPSFGSDFTPWPSSISSTSLFGESDDIGEGSAGLTCPICGGTRAVTGVGVQADMLSLRIVGPLKELIVVWLICRARVGCWAELVWLFGRAVTAEDWTS